VNGVTLFAGLRSKCNMPCIVARCTKCVPLNVEYEVVLRDLVVNIDDRQAQVHLVRLVRSTGAVVSLAEVRLWATHGTWPQNNREGMGRNNRR
jgi:hypothetical protein